MSGKELVAVLWGRKAGRVSMDRGGRLRFVYEEEHRAAEGAVPLSLSLPLGLAEHSHKPVEAYLAGLLPDQREVLARWGERFGVSPRNPFALLSHVGEDCAGAVQFVTPERLGAVEGEGPEQVDWLTEAEVAARLEGLRTDPGAWRGPDDAGQFSLAGAQAKTALLCRDGRWGVPRGRTPTSHILKPPMPDFPGHVENEHLCLTLARELGLAAAFSEVRRFGQETVIVVTRFDRTWSTPPGAPARARRLWRLHQEDLCQALGVHPASRYQSDGGPSPARIVELLREHSGNANEDVAAFVDALALNWLIGGTDGHAKNYSLLHGGGGVVRLAPLYDVASVLPHPRFDPQRLRLAMRIGRTYRLREIGASDWRALAKDLRLDEADVLARLRDLAARVPPGLASARDRLAESGLDRRTVEGLADLLANHARKCARLLDLAR